GIVLASWVVSRRTGRGWNASGAAFALVLIELCERHLFLCDCGLRGRSALSPEKPLLLKYSSAVNLLLDDRGHSHRANYAEPIRCRSEHSLGENSSTRHSSAFGITQSVFSPATRPLAARLSAGI